MVRSPSVRLHFQRSSSLKPLGQSKPNFMWSLLGQGERKLFETSGSHDQDGHNAQIWQKPFKNFLQNWPADFHETWDVASGTPIHHTVVCSNDDTGVTLTYLTVR